MLTGIKCEAGRPGYLGCVATHAHSSDSPVAGCSVPPAAGLRDWFRRAAQCQAWPHASGAARLRGVHVALLHPPGSSGRRTPLDKAIDRLGAKAVSIEYTAEDGAGGTRDAAALARVLGRLYHAVDCTDMEAEVVRSIAREAGIPVFCGLGGEDHPVRAFGELWTIDKAADEAGRQIRFIGSAKADPARAFMTAATRLGFGVETNGQGAAMRPAPFTVDAGDPGCWTLRRGSTPVGQALRLENRICLIQALLLWEILGP